MPSSVPLVDLSPWFAGTSEGRAEVAGRIDRALRESGFLLVTGHGVPDDLRHRTRELAREFFALPEDVKQRYAVTVGGRGWLPPGVEANGYAEGTETPPDLKESYSAGADTRTGVAEVDGFWFQPNVWPHEVPGLGEVATEYMRRMRALAVDGLAVEHLHAAAVQDLPVHHRDPFDRLLVAQAQAVGATLVTADTALRPYDVPILWAG